METSEEDAKIKLIIDNMEPEKESKDEVFDKEEDSMDMDKQMLMGRNVGGEISNVHAKTKRKVHWNDSNGNKLAQVLVFVPSDASDTDDDDADACFCTIM